MWQKSAQEEGSEEGWTKGLGIGNGTESETTDRGREEPEANGLSSPAEAQDAAMARRSVSSACAHDTATTLCASHMRSQKTRI